MDDLDAIIDGVAEGQAKDLKTLDPIDAAIDSVADSSDTLLKTNLYDATKTNTERFAKANKIRTFMGTGADATSFYDRNLEETERELRARSVEGKIRKAPTLQDKMTSDSHFTKLTIDDEALPDIETALRTQGFKAASKQRRQAQDKEIKQRWEGYLGVKRDDGAIIPDALASAAGGANMMAAGFTEFGRLNPVNRVFAKALEIFAPDVNAEYESLNASVDAQLGSNVEYWQKQKSFEVQADLEAFNQANLKDAIGMLATNPRLLVDQLAQSTPYLITGIGAAKAGEAGTLAYTTIVEAMDAANTARQESLARGETLEQQNQAASIAALVTAPFAFLGNKLTGAAKLETEFLTKGSTGNSLLSAVVREAISGGAEEGGNQFGVNVAAVNAGDDRGLLDNVGKATGVGAFLESVQGGGIRGISLATQKINGETELAQDIASDAENLKQAVDTVAQTKLLERDESALRGYMQQVANDMGLETVDGETKVYVDPETLSQIVSEIPELEKQISVAQEAGHDVAVNMGDLIVVMAKTGTAEQIIPNIRFSADQATVAEAQANVKPEQEAMLNTARQMATEEMLNTQAQQESQAVYEDVLSQLSTANAFSRDVNAPYARLHQSFYETYAHRLNMPVSEFYSTYGMKVSNVDNGGFNQDTPAFKNWFGDSKVVDADGKPVVVYHGTDKKFSKVNMKKGAQGIFWFTSDKSAIEAGEVGASGNGEIIELYAKLKNPAGWAEYDKFGIGELIARGYDGAILPDKDGTFVGFIFEPNQVKSSSKNDGNYSLANDNIYKQSDKEPRGTFNPETNTIALLNAADLSTFLHESSHGFLEILSQLDTEPMQQDVAKIMEFFGTDIETFRNMTLEQKRPLHEKWAESAERYFFEGKAPTQELQPVFQRFRDWMKSVYKSLQELLRLRPDAGALNDDVRQVLDRMFATDEAIAKAQEARALLPLFANQSESGMTDAEWDNYQFNALAATQQAIDDMNKRSLRDMRWMRRARDSYMRGMQSETEALRREVNIEARRNVLSQPIYQAWVFLTGKEWGKVSKATAKKGLDPSKDSLLVAISKLGGLNLEQATKEYGMLDEELKAKPVFGKPLFKKTGLLYDNMAELLVEYGYLPVDENGKHSLRDLEDYIFDELRDNFHYSYAYDPDTDAEFNYAQQLPAARLSLDSVKNILGDDWETAKPKLGRMVASDGISPDVVAEMYDGFLSGRELVLKLIDTKPPSEAIKLESDRIMLERYGDINSSEALESAADEALHNEAMLRMGASELKALLKINTPVRQLEKAAKESAVNVLRETLVKDINPNKYASAAARAARAADKAITKRDIQGAAEQKRAHILNLSLTKEAYAAKSEVAKSLTEMRKLKKSDKDLAKTHDINMVDTARAIASAFGINGELENPAIALEALEKVKNYDNETYVQLLPVVQSAMFNAKSYRELSLEDFRGLAATVQQLMHKARKAKQITVDGRKVDIAEARDVLIARLEDLGIPDEVGKNEAVTDKDRAWWNLNGMANALKRMESWVDNKDNGNFLGEFRTYLYNGVREGVDKYRTRKNEVLKDYVKEIQRKDIAGEFSHDKIASDEIGYSFNGKSELLGAMLHIGNDSNKRKLLLGRGWGKLLDNPDGTRTLDSSKWDNFIKRLMKDGTLTKSDMDFLQFTWDLMDSIKADAQKAHFEIYGYYFDEVTADPIQTPWGEYKGGYAPANADTELVQDAAIRQGSNEIETDFNYMMPSTGNGFTKGRVEYNRPLVMDLRLVAKHIDHVLRFTYIQPAVVDTLKLVKDRKFAETLRKYDQTAMDALILPWLQRTASQITTTPFTGKYDGKPLQRWLTKLRRNSGMSIMFANLVNALQQLTGLSIAAVKVKPRYFKHGLASYISSPNATANSIAEMSPWMAQRLDTELFEMQQAMDDILLDTSTYDKVQGFAARHAYFIQRAFQNTVDIVTWKSAYEESIAQGLTQDESVSRADSIVRQTQGSLNAEDLSKFETGNAFVQLFTQFYNYFNMQANLLGNEFSKTMREQGVRKGAGRLLYVYTFGFAIPALMADAIVRTFGWDWDDEDDDGYLDEFNAWFFGSQVRTGVAMIPLAGNLANAFINRFNDRYYDDRISTSPAISLIEQAMGAPTSVYKSVTDDGSKKKAIKDSLTLISLTTGIPVSALGKPLGYMAEVNEGDAEPANNLDLVRGLVSGKSREAER